MSGTVSDKNIPDISNVVEKILGDIQRLQQMEQELFTKIERDSSLNPQKQQEITDQINKLSEMRSNLYSTLSEINNFYERAMDSSTGTLKQQTAAINIVETELNRSKKRLQALKMEKNNKIRLVEINTYYGDKYAEHSLLMRIVIFTLIPIIILTILLNNGFLPVRIYYFLFLIVGIIGAWYFLKTYISIISRDNMHYNEYDWAFDKSKAPKPGSGNNNDPWATLGAGICVGEYCCSDGQMYDTKINQCIGSSKINGNNQDKITNALTKTQPGKFKSDYNLSELNPYNY
jgi:hypothetical protein